jgi:ornithine cyclodeaminase
MPTILTDADVTTDLRADDAVRWMGEAVDAHYRGDLSAPPRVTADLDGGRMVFTVGRLRGEWVGYRSYDTFPHQDGTQTVVVHDEVTGALRALAVGREVGPRRTGAIGGVAVDALAAPDARIAAVIGTGPHAYTQVWAFAALRPWAEIRVYSRDATRRRAFVERIAPLTGARCIAADDARSAVEGAGVVILATTSPTPVVEAGWLAPGCQVSTLGQPGTTNEFGPDLVAAAGLLVTDAPAQLGAYDPALVLAGTGDPGRVVPLGAVRAGDAPRPTEGIRLFLSVGLAGTEAYLVDRLAALRCATV